MDCDYGTRPFLWVNEAQGFLVGAAYYPSGYWVYLPEPELIAPYVNQTAAEVELEAVELPPFQGPYEDLVIDDVLA